MTALPRYLRFAAMAAVLLGASLPVSAQIDSTIVEHASVIPTLTEAAWANPALIDARYRLSLSGVGAGYHNDPDERYGYFSAESYLKTGNLTLSANAGYQNGYMPDVDYETSDAAIVYPYHTFDTIRGNMNLERYSFGGSCDVSLGKWTVGASLSYDAGLYYRSVDPRPRNVTGLLKIAAGGSYALSGCYRIGLGLGYTKYKQSSDITFISELGETTIYHLTGLGTRYERFTGLGKSTYYTGYAFAGSVTLLPAEKGAYLNVGGEIFKNTHVLVDLNKLPMARTDNRSVSFEGGWKAPGGGVTVSGEISERHGYENIFGDAVSGQYLQIGSLGMYRARAYSLGARGAAVFRPGRCVISLLPSADYYRFTQEYRYPALYDSQNLFAFGSGMRAVSALERGLVLRGDVSVKGVVDDGDWRASCGVSAGADVPIMSRRYAIGVDLSYAHDLLGINRFQVSAAFKF